MRVLIIKTTSLGDLIHLLPALTDAKKAIPDIQFDWVVESSFQEVPSWHEAVNRVIPVKLRQWRKKPFAKNTREAWREFKKILGQTRYDKIIDAQGLMKSAFLTRHAQGSRYGLNFRSAWEPLASLFYQHRVSVDPKQHAVVRMRRLMAACLDYECPTTTPNYGINTQKLFTSKLPLSADARSSMNDIIFIHGTTWDTKEWPVEYWQDLLNRVAAEGYRVLIPWGNEREHQRAKAIAAVHSSAEVLPKLSLLEVAAVLAHARGAVAVDTGIGHLAAALALPTVSLYGPTDPLATGAMGANQLHLSAKFSCAPCLSEHCHYKSEAAIQPACFAQVSPEIVWDSLQKMIGSAC